MTVEYYFRVNDVLINNKFRCLDDKIRWKKKQKYTNLAQWIKVSSHYLNYKTAAFPVGYCL